MRKEIRKDCFWYRPWKDMSATFNQCELEEPTKCSCTESCEWYISKVKADEAILTAQRYNRLQKKFVTKLFLNDIQGIK